MEAQIAQFANRGMNQDISVSKATNEFAFKNYNIRITAVNDNTLLSVTNEKLPADKNVAITKKGLIDNVITFNAGGGFTSEYPVHTNVIIRVSYTIASTGVSKEAELTILKDTSFISFTGRYIVINNYELVSSRTDGKYFYSFSDEVIDNPYQEKIYTEILGEYIGHGILNEYLVLFTRAEDYDRIYRLEYIDDAFEGELLFEGSLGFKDIDGYIETLPYYESEEIQKIYWVDGVHQTRFINIVSDEILLGSDTQFGFNPTINRFPKVSIDKDYNGIGLFPSGVIQYFISYYNKFGAETNIVWSSALHYINFQDRAGSPEETITCSFNITIKNLDPFFNHIRVYSLKRTSYNGDVVASIVGDINIKGKTSVSIVDTNTNQEIVDSSMLLFLGGREFIAGTLDQKDDTLFLGDIKSNVTPIDSSILDYINDNSRYSVGETYEDNQSNWVSFNQKCFNYPEAEGYYPYTQQTNNSSISFKTFKRGEIYRFGLQFQTSTGEWTSVVWIGDKKCDIIPTLDEENHQMMVANATVSLPLELQELLSSNGYNNYRLLMAETNFSTRETVAQGVVCPTVFNYKERCDNKPYAISSWIMRPRGGNANFENLSHTGHNRADNGEIQMLDTISPPIINNDVTDEDLIENQYNALIFDIVFYKYKKVKILVYGVSTDVHPELPSNEYFYETSTESIDIIKNAFGEELPLIKEYFFNKNRWKQLYPCIVKVYAEFGIDVTLRLLETEIDNMAKYGWIYPTWHRYTYSGNESDINTGSAYNGVKVKSEYFSYETLYSTKKQADIDNKRNNYYIDSSIVTFHSPELEQTKDIIDNSNLQFRIVGIVPITSNYSDVYLNKDNSLSPGANINLNDVNHENLSVTPDTLITFNYSDYNWVLNVDPEDYSGDSDWFSVDSTFKNYKVHLWNKSGSLIGYNKDFYRKLGDAEFVNEPSKLVQKTMATQRFSYNTKYLNSIWKSEISKTKVYDSDVIDVVTLDINGHNVLYQGNYDTLLAPKSEGYYAIYNYVRDYYEPAVKDDPDWQYKAKQNIYHDTIRIKYKSTPHVVFGMFDSEDGICNELPYLSAQETQSTLNEIYDDVFNNFSLPWSDIFGSLQYTQEAIGEISTEYPYLYIGELYRNIPYNSLYGGTDNNALEQINWIPISISTNIKNSVTKTDGDTYYQRWDCLKTYPFTEEDENSVVDITSFMVESHINLDGRYDSNRGINNILYSRPKNFNLINEVYSQENNYLSQYTLGDKYVEEYKHQVLFSLQKTPTSDVDVWTSISMASALNLNGLYGNLNKILNFNDTLITFQDKAISAINFNNRTALSTENGVPIEIANSGKVDGYATLTTNSGCTNKWSICQAASGVYFADDLNKTFMRFNKEGLSNISSNGMSMWFKENLSNSERVSYDAITSDIYITNSTDCLVYNEGLQSFTSFMDYNDIDILFNLKGYSFILDNLTPKKMFDGNYSNKYYVQYKVNPEPYMDKTFTNIEYIADCIPSNVDIDTIGKTTNLPFDKLDVWNEYQEGSTDLAKRFKYPNFENKFRIWRADIPRDNNSKHKLDRIRNPWIYLKLSSDNNHLNKMVFHNLLVKYFK